MGEKKEIFNINNFKVHKETTALGLIKAYMTYVNNYKTRHKAIYDEINQQFEEDNKAVDKILEGFDLVDFTTVDGQLEPYFTSENGRKITFTINSLLTDKEKNNSDIIASSNEYIKQEQERIDEIRNKIADIKSQIENLQPRKPKKILGIFVSQKDKKRSLHSYNRKLKQLQRTLKDLEDDEKVIQYQIDSHKHTLTSLSEMDNFINGLSPEQKKQIIEKYNQVYEVFKVDQIYQQKLNFLNSNMCNLYEYVEKIKKVDAKKTLFPLLNVLSIAKKYLPQNKANMSWQELSSHYDFGIYKTELDVLAQAIDEKQFGKMTRQTIRDIQKEIYKDELKKKNAKKNSTKKSTQTSSSNSKSSKEM